MCNIFVTKILHILKFLFLLYLIINSYKIVLHNLASVFEFFLNIPCHSFQHACFLSLFLQFVLYRFYKQICGVEEAIIHRQEKVGRNDLQKYVLCWAMVNIFYIAVAVNQLSWYSKSHCLLVQPILYRWRWRGIQVVYDCFKSGFSLWVKWHRQIRDALLYQKLRPRPVSDIVQISASKKQAFVLPHGTARNQDVKWRLLFCFHS